MLVVRPHIHPVTLTLAFSHQGRGDSPHASSPLDTRLRGYEGGFAHIPKGSSEVKRVLHNLSIVARLFGLLCVM